MKITRFKKSQKYLAFFASNFNYREPYQVLVDATFCQAALKNKVNAEEQLKKCFQSPPKLLTTQCIILEAESLGASLTAAATIVKKFYVHKCGHEGKPVSATECIKSMVRESRYIVASQDRSLQESLRKVPGRCLLYLHRVTPVLEAPSDASKKYVLKKSKNLLPKKLEERIETMKKVHGLEVAPSVNEKKRRGPKNPNPLSCKKSKKQKSRTAAGERRENVGANDKSSTLVKPKRKRIKLPTHIKEIIKAGGVSSS